MWPRDSPTFSEMKRSMFFYIPVLVFVPMVVLLYIHMEMSLNYKGSDEPKTLGGLAQSRHERENILEVSKLRGGENVKDRVVRMAVPPEEQKEQGQGDPVPGPGQLLQEDDVVKVAAGNISFPPFVNDVNKLGEFSMLLLLLLLFMVVALLTVLSSSLCW